MNPNTWSSSNYNPYAAWYNQPPNHPHIYTPPPQTFTHPSASAWGYPANWNASHHEEYRSKKYPNLNPLLAPDTNLTVRYDIRKKPTKESILRPTTPTSSSSTSSTFQAYRTAQAVSGTPYHMRFYSRSFPWTVEIKSAPGSVVTCENVWEALYYALQEPMADSEWGVLVSGADQHRIDSVFKAARKRYQSEEGIIGESGSSSANVPLKKLKRIDWLGEGTVFKGLEKDNEFAKRRALPGSSLKECEETWMVKFGMI